MSDTPRTDTHSAERLRELAAPLIELSKRTHHYHEGAVMAELLAALDERERELTAAKEAREKAEAELFNMRDFVTRRIKREEQLEEDLRAEQQTREQSESSLRSAHLRTEKVLKILGIEAGKWCSGNIEHASDETLAKMVQAREDACDNDHEVVCSALRSAREALAFELSENEALKPGTTVYEFQKFTASQELRLRAALAKAKGGEQV